MLKIDSYGDGVQATVEMIQYLILNDPPLIEEENEMVRLTPAGLKKSKEICHDILNSLNLPEP